MNHVLNSLSLFATRPLLSQLVPLPQEMELASPKNVFNRFRIAPPAGKDRSVCSSKRMMISPFAKAVWGALRPISTTSTPYKSSVRLKPSFSTSKSASPFSSVFAHSNVCGVLLALTSMKPGERSSPGERSCAGCRLALFFSGISSSRQYFSGRVVCNG